MEDGVVLVELHKVGVSFVILCINGSKLIFDRSFIFKILIIEVLGSEVEENHDVREVLGGLFKAGAHSPGEVLVQELLVTASHVDL